MYHPLEVTFDYGLKNSLNQSGDGDQGVLVDALNAYDPTYYRNVFGAEKYPVHQVNDEVAVIDIDIPSLISPMRKALMNRLASKKDRSLQKDTWWTKHQYLYYVVFGVKYYGRRMQCRKTINVQKLGRTERALNNIDVTW